MPRRLRPILLLALIVPLTGLGLTAATNTAALVWPGPPTWADLEPGGTLHLDDQDMDLYWQHGRHGLWRSFRVMGPGIEEVFPPRGDGPRRSQIKFVPLDFNERRRVPVRARRSHREAIGDTGDFGLVDGQWYRILIVVEYGWPLPFLRGWTVPARGGPMAQRHLAQLSQDQTRASLPTQIVWPNAIANILILGAVPVAVLLAFTTSRRALRRRRGRCSNCGYPHHPGPVCPECGRPIDPPEQPLSPTDISSSPAPDPEQHP
jgi:hypothetical protein